MTGFFRSYSLASLAVMVLAGGAMFVHHRSVLTDSVKAIAETSSVTTARMALHPIRVQLAGYIEVANQAGHDPTSVKMPEALQQSIAEMIRDSRVVRVKVYNRDGIVIFSTRREQIGDTQEANQGFATAMAGKVSVQLIYRDTFNAFDRVTEEDNLVQTYFPVRGLPTAPILGVFEIYTDVNSLVIEAERSELLMLFGTVLLIGGVYAALLVLVYRTQDQLDAHQRTIAEKNALLEQLSRESMQREQDERKRFSAELHEGLAQSLSAVKVALEKVRGDARAKGSDALEAIIPSLQDAIGHARAIAVDLYPRSLEDFGLGAAVRELCGEFSSAHAGVKLEHAIDIVESNIPAGLRVTVYRILETVLGMIGGNAQVTRLRVALQSSSRALTLILEDDAGALVRAMRDEGDLLDPHSPFGLIRERVMITKGALAILDGAAGAQVLRATWLL
jgi:signal transduction histidine kinase